MPNKFVSVSSRKMYGIQLIRSHSWNGYKWMLSFGFGAKCVSYTWGLNPENPKYMEEKAIEAEQEKAIQSKCHSDCESLLL